MLREHWEELVAQVESHGPESVVLTASDVGDNGEDVELFVMDVVYEDNEIKVKLQ